MKNTELRIGNYVQTDKGIEQVLSVYGKEDRIGIETKSYVYYPIENVKAVRLTQEMLIDAGFEKSKPRSGVFCAFVKEGIRINMSNSLNFYYHRWNTIDSLHELQNFWHGIFKVDLTIKL